MNESSIDKFFADKKTRIHHAGFFIDFALVRASTSPDELALSCITYDRDEQLAS